MRSIFHPSIADVKVDAILFALSDPIRIAIILELLDSCAPQNCSEFLNITDKPTNKSTLSRHIKILRDAGLLYSKWEGVELQNISRCDEVEKRFPGLLSGIYNAYSLERRGDSSQRKSSPAKNSSAKIKVSAKADQRVTKTAVKLKAAAHAS